jgi:hypothetical protein
VPENQLTLLGEDDPMGGPQGDRWTAETEAQHPTTPMLDPTKETGSMKQSPYTNAAAGSAAGVARLRAGHGICAYPWHLGGQRTNPVNGMNVDLTESKYHFRWPGGPSS